jgi:hypothetical protein
LKQVSLIENIHQEVIAKHPNGRLMTDSWLRLLKRDPVTAKLAPVADGTVFALGDCAANVEKPLPALAQVRKFTFLLLVLNNVCFLLTNMFCLVFVVN